MSKKVFALMDCNNFYASCERVFNPSLQNKPIVVLSNNDGCIVARSNESKRLGIPMGAPLFKCRDIIKRNKVKVFSSNYTLYGDMSDRVMSSLSHFIPDIEVYSIDEAFMRLDPISRNNSAEMAKEIRDKVLQWTGIPTSIGIAPTKTLAKVANAIAKQQGTTGVFDICDQGLQTNILRRLPVEDIWGISTGRGDRLRKLRIRTALELRDADPQLIRKHLSVVGERIVYELRGVSCLNLEEMRPKQNIMSSKSFGTSVTTFQSLSEALSQYTSRACEKLRSQNSKAQGIYVFVRTNRFSHKEEYYQNSVTIGFDHPTSETSLIISLAKRGLSSIYKSGLSYKKCGILLMDLIPETQHQQNLFSQYNSETQDKLMKAMDSINKTMGTGTIFHAAQGTSQAWLMKSDRRTPRYTTCWNELPFVS